MYNQRAPLLYATFRDGHFPLLKKCQLKLRDDYNFEINDSETSANSLLRSLAIDKWHWSKLGFLLHRLPNLRRFETNFEKSCESTIHCIQPHLLLKHLKITLDDPLHDVEKLLKWTPNLTRLRVRGNISSDDVLKYFEKMAQFLPTLVPHLQYFDCEIYCYFSGNEGYELIIQQLHPLFRKIRCLFGRDQYKCYATDIVTYPFGNEYHCE